MDANIPYPYHPRCTGPHPPTMPPTRAVALLLLAACCLASFAHAGYVDPDDNWRVCRAYVPNVNYYKCQQCASKTRCNTCRDGYLINKDGYCGEKCMPGYR